jgi:alpha-ketoglutarate-dependent taurine dioxygenase
MDTFLSHYADIHAPAQHDLVIAQLRDQGLVTFSGVRDRATLLAAARRLLAVRPHPDAGTDGVTVITVSANTARPGYAAFTDAELSPHTDGTGVPDPPQLMLLACLQPSAEGGQSCVADGARIAGVLADRYPGALRALSEPCSALFGAAGGYLGSVFEDTGGGRVRIRLRLDELARFPAEVTSILPLLRTIIDQHTQSFRLRSGDGLLLSNTRWLHARQRFTGQRVMLRVLGDPLRDAGIEPGFTFQGRSASFC